MNHFEYNIIPWSSSPPTKPGWYLALLDKEMMIVVSVYPEKGNLVAEVGSPHVGTFPLEKMVNVKMWSPRITWA